MPQSPRTPTTDAFSVPSTMADGEHSDPEEVCEFEDASETIPVSTEDDLLAAIEAANISLHLFLDNQFHEALEKLKPWYDKSIYHALGYSALLFIQALMTFDPDDVDAAVKELSKALEFVSKRRRKSTIVNNTVTKIVKRPNYNAYTEEEIHAELVYAELLLLRALASFVQDESLISFIKGGLRIRSTYMSYRECYDILEYRNWSCPKLKMHFQSGVLLGIGTFNLVISSLPTRILRLLEFIGFSGNKDLAYNKLDAGQRMTKSIRGPLCSLCLLLYNTIVLFTFANGKIDLEYCKSVLDPLYQAHPKGALVQFFKAKLEETQGNVLTTVEYLTTSLEALEGWDNFNLLWYWELGWCNGMLGNWRKALHYIELLEKGSHWSKAIPMYLRASVLLMCNDITQDEREEVARLMLMIPKVRRRFAGKSVPLEKFYCKRAKRYIEQGNWLFAPAVETVHTWNYFLIAGKNRDVMSRMLTIVDRALDDLIQTKKDSCFYVDNYCLGTFLKGICLRYLNSPLLAEECFKEVCHNEKKIREDAHLVPWSLVEMGYMFMDLKKMEEAEKFLEAAKNNYKGYSMESRLHFKVHAALAEIRNSGRPSTHLNGSGLSQPPSPADAAFSDPLPLPQSSSIGSINECESIRL